MGVFDLKVKLSTPPQKEILMLSINELKSGSLIIAEGTPYQVLEVSHLHMGRGGSSVQTRIRNLKTGQVLNRNFKPADTFEEADVQKKQVLFLYVHRGEYVFADPANQKDRFSLKEALVGDHTRWLKPNTQLTALFLGEKLLSFILPIKMDFTVTEAPPGLQGDRSQAGTKTATIETGASVQVPLFINTDDIIRINTETGEYVERVEKA